MHRPGMMAGTVRNSGRCPQGRKSGIGTAIVTDGREIPAAVAAADSPADRAGARATGAAAAGMRDGKAVGVRNDAPESA